MYSYAPKVFHDIKGGFPTLTFSYAMSHLEIGGGIPLLLILPR